MSCTCKVNPLCEPCAFCTPPGVTNLTTCVPVDPCPEKINLDCVLYSGDAHTCSSITHLQSLTNILIKIFKIIYPNNYCCFVNGSLISVSILNNIYKLKITSSGLDPGPFNIFYIHSVTGDITNGDKNVPKSSFITSGYIITVPVDTEYVRLQSINSDCPYTDFRIY
jgi:hypothetical protein